MTTCRSSRARTSASAARSRTCYPERNKVIVESSEGINVAKKHQKPTRATMQGGIQDKVMPIHVSNLMLVCSKDGPVKVGYRIDANGEKHRVCRKCGAEL